MPSTYKDIQRLTGLSLSTISKYLNGGNVLEQNARAIDKAIETLDFRVNEFARGLKTRRSNTVGILIPELNSTFNTTIIADVEDLLRQKGYGAIVCDCRMDKAREKEALEFLLGKMVDGIINIPCDSSGRHLAGAKQREIPVVLLDRPVSAPGFDTILVDNFTASRRAAGEFARRGHRRAAILCGPKEHYTMRERMRGFDAGLREHGMDRGPQAVVTVEHTIDGGYRGAKELLNQPNRPTAVFCANYEITVGTIIAVNETGLKIPEELSIIGFDDLTLSQLIRPPLAIVSQPMRQMAETAAELLLRRMNGGDREPGVYTLPLSFLNGKSVSAPQERY